jgi:SAM-dependent methyltransferase
MGSAVATGAERGSAGLQGELWGARAQAWAEQEGQSAPVYEEALRLTGVGAGTSVLDVGCGSGSFLRAAADRGAQVTGLGASEALAALARVRVSEADIRVGDVQFLPYDTDTFDVVTGFNSFQFAAELTAGLREAARVAKPGGSVFVQVWGSPERCDLSAMLRAVGPLLPPRPASPSLSEPGVLEAVAVRAGLVPHTTGDLRCASEYLDEEAMLRAITSAGLVVLAVRTAGGDRPRSRA